MDAGRHVSRPIIFDDESMRGILSGTKIMTRRVVKFNYGTHEDYMLALPMSLRQVGIEAWRFDRFPTTTCRSEHENMRCPYGGVGDRLWVREAFQLVEPCGSVGGEWIGDDIREVDGRLNKGKPKLLETGWWSLLYRADEQVDDIWWRNAIFMPRWASRVELVIKSVEAQRLHKIWDSEIDCEGWLGDVYDVAGMRAWFKARWNAINGKRGFPWDRNPWVWVLEFEKVEEKENVENAQKQAG